MYHPWMARSRGTGSCYDLCPHLHGQGGRSRRCPRGHEAPRRTVGGEPTNVAYTVYCGALRQCHRESWKRAASFRGADTTRRPADCDPSRGAQVLHVGRRGGSFGVACAATAKPGRVYVLDMGEDLAIADIAQRLAQLHGLRVPEDIGIVYTGLRPGERLREILLGSGESLHPTPQVGELAGLECRSAGYWDGVIEKLVANATTAGSDRLREDLLAAVAPAPLSAAGQETS